MLVSWNTTNACNLYCQHCYRNAREKLQNELSTSEGMALIEEISRSGFKIMVFSGGEPLLRQDIFTLVDYAQKKGLRPVFGTNGTLITSKIARRLKEAGAKTIGISLDSLNPDKHDRWRSSSGAWQAAVDGMKACREADLSFQINTTVADWNYHEIEDLTDFAVEIGACAHHIFFLVPTGRAVNIEEGLLSAQKYEDLLYRILKKQQKTSIELKPTCAPQFMRVARQMGMKLRFSRGCLAGVGYCIITPCGDVQPCAYLNISAGNVREIPFSRIWQDSPVFSRLRSQEYLGACGLCEYRKICGGCRARAYFYYGDYMNADPVCLYKNNRR